MGPNGGRRDGTRRGRLPPVLALVALAAAAAPIPSRAADLFARADLTWQEDQGLAASDSYFRQVYFLQFARAVSEPISYRLALQLQDIRGTTVAGGVESPLQYQTISPLASLQWRLDDFGLGLLYQLNSGGDYDVNTNQFIARTIERWGGRVYVRPTKGLEVSLSGYHQAYSSVLADNQEDRLVLAIEYRMPNFWIKVDGRIQPYYDYLEQFERMTYAPRLALQYTNGAEGKWSIAVGYAFEYYRNEQRALAASAVSVPTDVQPAMGLYVRTDLPSDTSATPMVPEPRLVDGNLDASAGIALGPDGASFQNIGFDMARVVAVDEIRIPVRNGTGRPVSSGGAVTWTGYWSEDGRRWGELEGLTATFNAGLSAYVATFRRTSARYFKVVNFGVNTEETYVTEIQSYVVEQVKPNQTLTSDTVRQTGTFVGTWRPWEKLLLTYNGIFNIDGYQGLRTPSRQWRKDTSHVAEATVGPFASMRYGLRQALSYADTGGFVQRSVQTSLLLTYEPVRRALSTLEARRILDEVGARSAVTWSGLLYTRLDFYESLALNGTVGLNRQEVKNGPTTQYVTANANLLAKVYGPFELALDTTVQWPFATTGETSAALQEIRIASYQRYTAEVRLNPGARLDLRAQIGWAASDVTSGIVQHYRAHWEPFPGGSLQIQLAYDESIDPLSGASYRLFLFRPSWTLNRNVILSLSYNVLRGSGGYATNQETFYVTLTLML